MEYLFIYLLQVANVLEGTQYVFLFLSLTSIMSWLAAIGIAFDKGALGEPNEEDKKYKTQLYEFYLLKTMFKKMTIFCIIILIILSLIPTRQTLLLMGGTYLGKKAVNAVVTDEKIKKVDTIINLQLDKYIKELQVKS